MPLPRQNYGLTNFYTSISKCPPNPDAIRAIVFQKDNLAVVNGPLTEMQIALNKFFVTVENAARISFSLDAAEGSQPYSIYKLDLAGVDVDGEVKFIALLPTYGTGASSSSQYVEWAFVDAIEEGQLYDMAAAGPSATTSFNYFNVNRFEFDWGSYLSFTGNTGSGPLWAGTDGGLLRWDGSNMSLWNTLNSNSYSDFISSLAVGASGIWVGTNNGISKFEETSGFSYHKNTDNSDIPSNTVNDVKIFSSSEILIATDAGLSLYNFEEDTWRNFTIYNTPSLDHNNIKRIAVYGETVFLGTTGGVYSYDFGASAWGTLLNSSVSGWSAPNDVQCLDYYSSNVYVGTTGGMVIAPYTGTTAQTIVSGSTGPASSNFSSIRIVDYDDTITLYAGHDDGFSVYGITGNSWYLKKTSGDFSFLTNSITDIVPDYLSANGATTQTIFLASATGGTGLGMYYRGTDILNNVPSVNDVTNLMLTYPPNPYNTPLEQSVGYVGGMWETKYGNTNVESNNLYPSNQPVYFVFSKDMVGSTSSVSFENYFTMKRGLTGTGATVSGSWTWDSSGKIATFTPSVELDKSQGYNMKISLGSTATDGTYLKENINVGFYTENIVPVLGWNPIGKLLILTGTLDHYTQGIYLRNTEALDVNFIGLIGR